MKIARSIEALMRAAVATLLVGVLLGCGAPPVASREARVYHCVAGEVPVPPANTWGKKYTTEEFEYGEYRINDSTIAKGIFGHTRCGEYLVPRTAYLRYRVDGRLLEKRFDLSALNAQRVQGKTVEFFADGDVVEVRLLTPVSGRYADSKEVIQRQ
jgi:hypothetical protein